MQVILGLLMAALIGADDTADSYAAPKAVVSRTGVLGTKSGPIIGFEIRDIRVSSPEWRGKLILRMQPVTRQGRDRRLVARSGRLQGASRALPLRYQERRPPGAEDDRPRRRSGADDERGDPPVCRFRETRGRWTSQPVDRWRSSPSWTRFTTVSASTCRAGTGPRSTARHSRLSEAPLNPPRRRDIVEGLASIKCRCPRTMPTDPGEELNFWSGWP